MKNFVLLIGLILLQAGPCFAQPLEDWPVLDMSTPVGRELSDLRAQTRPLLRENPEKAVEQYRKFVADRPDLSANYAVSVALTIAQIQARQMKNPAAALVTYKEALAKYPDAANKYSLLAAQVGLLREAGSTAEAAAILLPYWDEALARYFDDPRTAVTSVGPLMQQFVQLLEGENKGEEIVTRLSRAVFEVPALLDEDVQGVRQSSGWIFDTIIDQLLALKRTEEALSWAKLRFMLCDFNRPAISRSLKSLARVWKQQGAPGEAALAAFKLTLEDPSKPNPLRAVALPRFDQGQMALLTRSSLASDPSINVRLLTGAYDEAMKAAYVALLKPVKPAAIAPIIRGIARVFKAADLNLHRGNLFAATFATGEGADLVQRFVVESTAKPPARSRTEVQNEAKALKEFATLQAGLKNTEGDRPAEAIIRYRAFNDERPQLPAAAGVLVAASVARLHWAQNEKETALTVYDWALERYAGSPAIVRLVIDRARLVAGKEDLALAPVKVVWTD